MSHTLKAKQSPASTRITAPAPTATAVIPSFDALPDSAFIREAQLVPSPKRPGAAVPLPFSAPTSTRKTPVSPRIPARKAPHLPSVPTPQSGIFIPTEKASSASTKQTKHAVPKPLEALIAKEQRTWSATFPAEFYDELFRLYRLPCPPAGKKGCRPGFMGGITNDVIYSRIAPDLLPELKKAATRSERKARLHQWLTQDNGYLKLREHLAAIIAILKLSPTPESFRANVNTVYPRKGDTLPLDFGEAV